MVEQRKEVSQKAEYTVGTVATQTAPVIIDKNGEAIDEYQAIALILNKLEKLERVIG